MDNIELLKSAKVGDRVVVYSGSGRYSFGTIDKKTDKMIYVGHSSYYVPKYGIRWTERARGYSSSTGYLYPDTKEWRDAVKKSEEAEAERKREREIKAAEEASEKAQMEAFYATEEGKIFRALKEDWVGTKLDVQTDFSSGQRRATIFIVEPDGRRVFGGEINVYQKLNDWSPKDLIQPAEINHGAMQKNVGQTEMYITALQKAVEIAKLWNRDVGKRWDRAAKVAVDVEKEGE